MKFMKGSRTCLTAGLAALLWTAGDLSAQAVPVQEPSSDTEIAAALTGGVPMGRWNEGLLFDGIEQSIDGFKVMIVRYTASHMLPDVFLRIELGRIGWQRHKRDVGRHAQDSTSQDRSPGHRSPPGRGTLGSGGERISFSHL